MLTEICLHAVYDLVIVVMHDGTVCCGKYIVGTAFSVQSQCQRAVFFGIAKGKFHFIAVSGLHRASLDALEYICRIAVFIYLPGCPDGIVHQLFHLCFFQSQLICICHGLVHTSAAGWKL